MFVPRAPTTDHLARVDGYVRNFENEVAGRGLYGGVWNAVGAAGQPAWQNGATGDVDFMLDTEGFVYLRGYFTIGSTTLPAFTLPAGYRPAKTGRWRGSKSVLAVIEIRPDGGVYEIYSSGSGEVGVDGVAFRIV